MSITTLIVLLIIILCLSFGITWLIKKIALRYKVMDIPNERSSHTIPTPRGGGLAIVIAWYLGITLIYFFGIIQANIFYALLCGLLLAGISLIDDVIDLKPIIRLGAQLITVLGALYFLGGITSIEILSLKFDSMILVPFTIIGMIWFINLYNFLDGIDAYASIEAICVSMGLFLFTGNWILLILIASILGFLFWNWPKAKIFMGDVGSTQLGFVLVVLGIYFHNSHQFSIIHWIVLTAPFWFDATFTLYRRWRNNEKLSQAHKKHAYQRIVQVGFSHLKTDLYLIIINIIIFLLLLLSRHFELLIIPILLLTIILLYWLTKKIDKRKSF